MYKLVIITSNVEEIEAWLSMQRSSGRDYEVILTNYEGKYKTDILPIPNLRIVVNSSEELNTILDEMLLEDVAIIINSAIEDNDIIAHREFVKYVMNNKAVCYGRVWFYVTEVGSSYKDFREMFPENIVEASINFKTNGCDLELPKEEAVLLPSKFKYSVFDKFGKVNREYVNGEFSIEEFLDAIKVADFPGLVDEVEKDLSEKFSVTLKMSLLELLSFTEPYIAYESVDIQRKFIEYVVYRLQGTPKDETMQKMNIF